MEMARWGRQGQAAGARHEHKAEEHGEWPSRAQLTMSRQSVLIGDPIDRHGRCDCAGCGSRYLLSKVGSMCETRDEVYICVAKGKSKT